MTSIFGFPDWLALIITLVIIFIAFQKRRSHYWDRRRIPSFRPSLIQGNIQSPFIAKTSSSEQIATIYKLAKSKGYNYFGLYTFMLRPQFVPVNLNLLKNILIKDFQHFTDRGFFYNEKDDPLSAHLFSLGGQKWRNLRVKVTPTFTAGKMKQMFQTVANCGTILTNIMSDRLTKNDEPVDIKDILGCYSTDIICSCAFGLDSNTSNDPDSMFRRMGKKFFEDVSKWRLFLIIFSINLPKIARALHIRQTPKDVSDFFIKVVKDTINYRLKNNYTRNDFLQLMIEMQKNDPSLTLDIIAAQCFVFFIAGFETSSTTMTFALYELAKNQEMQRKVREEIEIVLKEHDGQVSYESIMELKYMGQVIEESLRKYPPLALLTRECVKDYIIPEDNILIKKGTKILIPSMGIHHDEEFYPNPTVFDPERFSDENRKNIPDMAYLPFGEGPRICIGLRFGMMQTKVGLLNLLKNFKFSINEKTQQPLKISPKSFVTSPEGGIWLNVDRI